MNKRVVLGAWLYSIISYPLSSVILLCCLGWLIVVGMWPQEGTEIMFKYGIKYRSKSVLSTVACAWGLPQMMLLCTLWLWACSGASHGRAPSFETCWTSGAQVHMDEFEGRLPWVDIVTQIANITILTPPWFKRTSFTALLRTASFMAFLSKS